MEMAAKCAPLQANRNDVVKVILCDIISIASPLLVSLKFLLVWLSLLKRIDIRALFWQTLTSSSILPTIFYSLLSFCTSFLSREVESKIYAIIFG